jgi:hypothetical protein
MSGKTGGFPLETRITRQIKCVVVVITTIRPLLCSGTGGLPSPGGGPSVFRALHTCVAPAPDTSPTRQRVRAPGESTRWRVGLVSAVCHAIVRRTGGVGQAFQPDSLLGMSDRLEHLTYKKTPPAGILRPASGADWNDAAGGAGRGNLNGWAGPIGSPRADRVGWAKAHLSGIAEESGPASCAGCAGSGRRRGGRRLLVSHSSGR